MQVDTLPVGPLQTNCYLATCQKTHQALLIDPGWNDPLDGSSQSLDYYFTTTVTSGNYTQGSGHQSALRTMYTQGLWYMTRFEMFEWGALWGNPDLRIDCDDLPLWPPQRLALTWVQLGLRRKAAARPGCEVWNRVGTRMP